MWVGFCALGLGCGLLGPIWCVARFVACRQMFYKSVCVCVCVCVWRESDRAVLICN